MFRPSPPDSDDDDPDYSPPPDVEMSSSSGSWSDVSAKIIRILVFKCEATENVLLAAACFFFIIPWETQREIYDIF